MFFYNFCLLTAPARVEQLEQLLHLLVGRGSTPRQRTDRISPCLTSLGMVFQQVSALAREIMSNGGRELKDARFFIINPFLSSFFSPFLSSLD